MFEHIKDLVEADDSGPRAWKLLRDVIQPNTLPMVIVLKKELAAISMRPGDDVKPQDQWTPEWLRQQILQEDFRRRHMGGGAATKTAKGLRELMGSLWGLGMFCWLKVCLLTFSLCGDCKRRECGHNVKVIRSDNGGEFIGADFEGELKRKGIQHQLTVPYNPQQNGVAERFNRTLQEGARTLLGRAGLPDPFWVSALRQVALVKNRVLATVGDKEWIPYVKWYGSAPVVNMLRAFGCMVVFHVPKEKRGKLEASGRWGVHLGIAKDHKGWLLWDLTTQKLTVAEQMLEMQFKCSKMGEVKYYLGMHVERDVEKGVLRLHQRKYCEGLAEKYGLQDGGKPATPLPSGFTVEPCADEEVVVKLAKNACLHGLTKHIRPKWHWVRRLLDKEVRLEIVKTHQQTAYIFTKRLAEADHWKGMKLAGMSVH
ncbi:hypothetical protein CLOM_g2289 [Closterium sp. NIES-68]|nr:hypothetical protein CLOM_g2289 [Closterium sp. NIES-68]